MQVRGKNKVKHKRDGEVSQGAVPFEDEVDTTLDCVELTKETLQ